MIPIRLRLGAISCSNCIHLPPIEKSQTTNPVMLPPGCLEALHQPEADRIGDQGENDRNGARSQAQGLSGG